MSHCLLGIDAGNTMIKAVLFSLDGRVLSVAGRAGATHQPRPGYAERPIEAMWHDVTGAINDCLQQAGDAGRRVIAVGAAGHGNGLYALDHRQQPVIGIQSIDSRADGLVRELERQGRREAIYQRSLQPPWSAATPVLMSWLKRHDAARYHRIAHVLCAKDVISHFLCGSLTGDYSDAAGAGLID